MIRKRLSDHEKMLQEKYALIKQMREEKEQSKLVPQRPFLLEEAANMVESLELPMNPRDVNEGRNTVEDITLKRPGISRPQSLPRKKQKILDDQPPPESIEVTEDPFLKPKQRPQYNTSEPVNQKDAWSKFADSLLPPEEKEVTPLYKTDSLFISNLPDSVMNDDIYDIFEEFGEIVNINVVKRADDSTRAFVTFRTPDEATLAMERMHEQDVFGTGEPLIVIRRKMIHRDASGTVTFNSERAPSSYPKKPPPMIASPVPPSSTVNQAEPLPTVDLPQPLASDNDGGRSAVVYDDI